MATAFHSELIATRHSGRLVHALAIFGLVSAVVMLGFMQRPAGAAIPPPAKHKLRTAGKISLRAPELLILPAALVATEEPGPTAPSKAQLQPPKLSEESAGAISITQDQTLSIEGRSLVLAGVELPRESAMCTRLDRKSVPCVDRIAARLALLSFGRRIKCMILTYGDGRRVGRCRADKIDLAADLIKERLVTRAPL
ncbi:MAG: hypothetical protein KGL46_05955 [Hyphomicrobiales bacterium]|nr:hypothetical protein [Hyphomicrobiales bacterium]